MRREVSGWNPVPLMIPMQISHSSPVGEQVWNNFQERRSHLHLLCGTRRYIFDDKTNAAYDLVNAKTTQCCTVYTTDCKDIVHVHREAVPVGFADSVDRFLTDPPYSTRRNTSKIIPIVSISQCLTWHL